MHSQTHPDKNIRVGGNPVAETSPQLKRMSSFSELPDDALISTLELSILAGRSRSSIWRDVRRGFLPKPRRVGPAAVRWQVQAVRKYLGGVSQDG